MAFTYVHKSAQQYAFLKNDLIAFDLIRNKHIYLSYWFLMTINLIYSDDKTT